MIPPIPRPRSPLSLLQAMLLSLLLLPSLPGAASAEEGGRGEILPAPRPFTLCRYDAQMAAALLERVGFVQIRQDEGFPETRAVREVRIVFTGKDPRYPEPYDRRYDLRLNGRPLNWNRTYVEYDFRMVNLRLLFTYRNQRPVPDVPYRLYEE